MSICSFYRVWDMKGAITSAGVVPFFLGAIVALGVTGCNSPTPPTEAPESYDRLVRLSAAEARVREDSTFLWLRNNETPEARQLMLELGLHYVRYDRDAGVICTWSGGGLGPAVGYGYRLPETSVAVDSIGGECYRQGSCRVDSLGESSWVYFHCW